jgi:hypothetical protein
VAHQRYIPASNIQAVDAGVKQKCNKIARSSGPSDYNFWTENATCPLARQFDDAANRYDIMTHYMRFKAWLALQEGSRWRQPAELQAMRMRMDPKTAELPIDRGSALAFAANTLGKKLPQLQNKLDALDWQDTEQTTKQAFQRGQQPDYVFRGHRSADPYLTRYNVVHASPWTSVASTYGSNVGGGVNSTARIP